MDGWNKTSLDYICRSIVSLITKDVRLGLVIESFSVGVQSHSAFVQVVEVHIPRPTFKGEKASYFSKSQSRI